MRSFILIVFIGFAGSFFAQSSIGSLTDFSRDSADNSFQRHSAIQPEIRCSNNLNPVFRSTDTINQKTRFIVLANPDSFVQFDSTFQYRAAAGFSTVFTSAKWYNRTSYAGGWATREGIDQNHTAFLPLHSRNEYWYNSIRTRLGFTPNKMLQLSAGIDNQFFGSGYRSLIQSDQVAPNPFAQMRVNFWHLEYGLLYQLLNENIGTQRNWKFNTTHYLSYNVTSKWNVMFLETVYFQSKDSTFNRGFEVEYLNPIVFFRPQEYSIGSVDNVLLGFNSSYIINQKAKIYTQFSLDEFVLSELKNRTRWWANKFAVQLGIRGNLNERFSYILEGNVARPYAYAHINSSQNAGNLGRPMGHPLGSNFAELLAVVQWKKNALTLKGFSVFQLQGFDIDSLSYGGNIYKDYTSHPKEYGNTIGQGQTVRNVQLGCELSYFIQSLSCRVFLSGSGRYTWGEIKSAATGQINIGLRSDLFVNRRLF